MLQFCSVSNSLSHTNLSNKVRGIYFSKRLCRSFLLLRLYCVVVMILHAYVDVLCACIVGHGYTFLIISETLLIYLNLN